MFSRRRRGARHADAHLCASLDSALTPAAAIGLPPAGAPIHEGQRNRRRMFGIMEDADRRRRRELRRIPAPSFVKVIDGDAKPMSLTEIVRHRI
jgi:hypothetical protein